MKQHWITDEDGEIVHKCNYLKDDSNDGLPLWFFEGKYIDFEVDGDHIEWWPECGPAPHWVGDTSDGWFKRWVVWVNATY